MEKNKDSEYYKLLIERDRLIGQIVLLQVKVQIINKKIEKERGA